jgi:hypothetical protein
MAGFIQKPATEWVGGKYPHKVVVPGIYETDVLPEGHPLKRIPIPLNYRTDFASVYRLPGMYLLFGGKAHLASLVHDILHDCHSDKTLTPEQAAIHGTVTQRQCDQIFAEIMALTKDPEWKITRGSMYLGVRVGGGFAWRRDSRSKCGYE